MGKQAGAFVVRWTVGEGGFLGEVTLQHLSAEDQYARQAGRPCYELTNLYVHPLRRGQGWAEQLVQKAVQHARRRGADLFLRCIPYGCVPADLDRLTRFYRRHGFRQLRRGEKRELVLRHGSP